MLTCAVEASAAAVAAPGCCSGLLTPGRREVARAKEPESRNSTADRISPSCLFACASTCCTAAKLGHCRNATCTDEGLGGHWIATAVTTPAGRCSTVVTARQLLSSLLLSSAWNINERVKHDA